MFQIACNTDYGELESESNENRKYFNITVC